MPHTLASLVNHTALKLTVLAGEEQLHVPVRWAHASELIDPVPYMEGGELLLITALKLDAEDAEATRSYVRRIARAGVVGLGFAVGVNYEGVPQALVEAAREQGLPLLGVPRKTPFIAISKAVSAAVAADQYRAVTAGFEAQRELTRAALGAEGPAELLARLAAHLDGWAALYDASGAVMAAAPDWAARRAARLAEDVGRLRERPAPASSVVSDTDGDDRVELQSLGTGRRARGVLAVGTAAPLGTAERFAVHSAVALLTLTTERSRALQDAEARLGAAVLKMLLAGEPDHARAVAGRLYGGLLDAPFRVVVAEPVPAEEQAPAAGGAVVPGSLDALADAMDSAAARTGEALLAVPDGGRLIVLVADGGAAAAACAAHAAEAESRAGSRAESRAGARPPARRRPRGGGGAPRRPVALGQDPPPGPLAAAPPHPPPA
ncbi:PucR family transcriptional regulator ligand-binding domain-containing protein, partial [Streptomyces sp. NPDC055299]